MKTCICRLHAQNVEGTGFFCKIPYKNKKIPVLITNYHLISDEFIENNKKIKININDDEYYEINLNENSKIYSSIKEEYDIMIIKLEEEKDICNYLELDESLFKDNSEKIYEDKSIYILHYPSGDKLSVSYGYGIQKEKEYYIRHYCNTEHGSSGSPILNLKTNKVIGIHSGFINKKTQFNLGVLLKYPLNKINDIKGKNIITPNDEKKTKKESIKTNEIKLTIKINKENINKDIYFLDNTDYTEDGIKHYHDNLKELNESNTELYINNSKYKYKKFFKPEKEGIYVIKLIFNIDINDCSYMFYNCNNIQNFDFSYFNPKNMTNISYMFYDCEFLKSLPDIYKWDTQNITDMSHMFAYCSSLESFPDISNWDTENVTDMSFIFFDCNSLKSFQIFLIGILKMLLI